MQPDDAAAQHDSVAPEDLRGTAAFDAGVGAMPSWAELVAEHADSVYRLARSVNGCADILDNAWEPLRTNHNEADDQDEKDFTPANTGKHGSHPTLDAAAPEAWRQRRPQSVIVPCDEHLHRKARQVVSRGTDR